MAVKGVDISGPIKISVAQLRAAGVEFVICKTGFGSDYPGQQDSGIEQNLRLLEDGGMPYGVYHFSYARDRAGGVAEAKHCLRMLGNRTPLYGVWFDMEAESTLGGDLVGAAQGFCDTVEAAGLYAGVYASTNWWQSYLTDSAFNQWDKWVAQYYKECQYKGSYGIWQYTDKLNIGGQNFDGNYAYKDYPSIVRGMTGETNTTTETEDDENMTLDQFSDLMAQYRKKLQDNDCSDWSKEAREWAISIGLISGSDPLPDGSPNYMWQDTTTREQMVQFFYNFAKSKGIL